MSYHAVLFDLDGTLLNTLEDLADSANFAFRQLGCPEHPVEAYKYLVGDGVENLVRRGLPPDRQDPPTMARCAVMLKQEYSERWARKTRPYDGIPELLDALTARKMPMAVLSNKPDEFVPLCLARLLPRWRFEAMLGAVARLPNKPDPRGALEIAQRLGVEPAEILYVGDSNTDMQTATAAGMYPVGVLWGFRTREELVAHGARVLLERPLDLIKLLAA